MSIAIGEDHLELLATARRFSADRCTPAVARAAIDAGGADRPPFWDDLAKLGWLGLAVPEDHGGEGYGYVELAVVLEELGRAMAPGPALTTAWAACALASGIGAGDPDVVELVKDLVAGVRVATVSLGEPLDATDVGGRTLVSGTVDPLLCGAQADVAIVSCRLPRTADDDGGPQAGREWWGVIDLAAATAEQLPSLDPTRPVARLEVALAPLTVVPMLCREKVEAIGLALAAAECAGGAAWCVDTAAAYAKDRRQFGRPIGQFQAVKHRCADMLVALEQARAVAWDAALALDEERDSRHPAGLSTAAAGAVALDAYVRIAKDCIQVLGGIGFTWEHDAHLYLRRAVALRQLFGGASPWRAHVARAALDGTRRSLTLELPPQAETFREEVRAFAAEVGQLPKEEQRPRVVAAGYAVPHWAPPWGRDAGAVEQLVIDEELRRARIRVPHLQVGAWAAPTIAAHGTLEQQERWVGPTLLGEISWCQLFSEPEAGSDLAALTTRATRTDGGWLLNGQKVWTTMAKEADWGICLARTNPTAPKHLGITYFIVDMRTPGIDIRPLRELTGLAMFNEVFLDDVFVPDDCVIGEVDGGWPLARTTLANERVSMGSGSSFGGGIETLIRLVAERVADGRLVADALLLDELGALVAEAHSVAVLGLRSTVRSVSGAKPGPEASVRKLLGVEHDQRTQELGLALLGPDGATVVGDAAQWTFGFLANRCLTIAGGTSEIQRNVIGERLLGLPRDPEVSG